MNAVLLDTHSWAWSLTADPRLSAGARSAIAAARAVTVSPVSFFEIAQKVRVGKWPEMATYVDRLVALLNQQGGQAAPLEPAICLSAGLMRWSHRDPFDRLLAATALYYGYPLVSADIAFDGTVPRIW
ncbi:type II toxin-antitoxin system VapC family toxin [Methylobacterium sp. E-066]|uniref:type II toxin-antitoxin system VapC family toxin n=1 Tax=Methylobacterium sp. E-066 TaxID=2836584 RepID=UPI001FB9C2C5|nr:type II toxin-antitoxin system VapC family toxin [Methylobacterium sp. E-066]MCJ2141090.1 type II toxin-antitoxin system VapC family toxin [Methylobacterium sp. E-066]